MHPPNIPPAPPPREEPTDKAPVYWAVRIAMTAGHGDAYTIGVGSDFTGANMAQRVASLMGAVDAGEALSGCDYHTGNFVIVPAQHIQHIELVWFPDPSAVPNVPDGFLTDPDIA